ncbi:PepSY domain-containing protein [Marivirga sp. S37H4]|uniref:PepSY domain-containing protein n=1 Tax=Marivirga aurantiaca TaxID=2802615 RepID=A0A935C604_9BACT|nr:PepSY domain-containing protein [Marivirga aurantiaca]MBK6264100.1 PepSY domain-containing protein [Marivirga aurantiaca]
MRKNKKYYIRKSHRYLGLFIGIQFIAWTISGLYFSWTNLDEIHGDHFLQSPQYLSADIATVSPDKVLASLKENHIVDSISSFQLIRILDIPYYQIKYFSNSSEKKQSVTTEYALANAQTGELRPPITKEEATLIAKEQVIHPAKLKEVEYLEEAGSHHEFRGRRLPVWAVTFEEPACAVYVSPESGTFQTIRHSKWRIFDFLWMFHTMDYAGRDNFNNWLLRIFSVFGLITVVSGFTLYVATSKTFKKTTSKRQVN